MLLFAASILAGWVENWFVLHRLDSAIQVQPAHHPLAGQSVRARAGAIAARQHLGLCRQLSLGLMLGLAPAFAAFFGLGAGGRHVTLSQGKLAWPPFHGSAAHEPLLWWAAGHGAVPHQRRR